MPTKPNKLFKPVDIQDLMFAKFDRNTWEPEHGLYDCWTIGQELYQRYGLTLPTREDLVQALANVVANPEHEHKDIFTCIWSQDSGKPLPFRLPPLCCLHFTMRPLHVGWAIWNGTDFFHIQEDTHVSIEPIHSPTWKRKLLEVRVLTSLLDQGENHVLAS